MIYQQKLQDAADSFFYTRVVRTNHHSFVDYCRASWGQLWHLLDIDKAHPAVAVYRQVGVIAIIEGLYTVVARGLNNGLARPRLSLLPVLSEFRHRFVFL